MSARVPEDYLRELEALVAAAQRELDARARAELASGARRLFSGLERASAAPAQSSAGRFGILGESEAIRAVFALVERFAPSDMSVLVSGESGTGKELVARALHSQSSRSGGPFVAENCAAIPETLLESILFGHVKGAFTGAHRDSPGHFASADGGTLLLDEIGDMPLLMQGKLLRVLQDGEVRPVGAERSKKVDVRLVAATNRDLVALVGEKRFRQDLFYRLNVLELRLPPLRDRGEDILLLAEHFLARSACDLGREPLVLGEAARDALRAAPWPGNVRELENVMRRAAALATGPTLEAADVVP